MSSYDQLSTIFIAITVLFYLVMSIIAKVASEIRYTTILTVTASCKTIKLMLRIVHPSSLLRTLSASVMSTCLAIMISEIIDPSVDLKRICERGCIRASTFSRTSL